VAERTGIPHFSHRAANRLNKYGVPHDKVTDDIVMLWQKDLNVGLVTAYRRGIAHKLTVTLELSEDGNTVSRVEVLE
jgi:hypothetical protein